MNAAAFAQTLFTPEQHQVLAALAKGASVTAAAQCAAVHRTSIYHWCRTNPKFREAINNTRQSYRANIQTEYEELARKALDTIIAILDDPKASAATRLRAAQAIIHQIHKPMVELPAAVSAPVSMPHPQPSAEPTNDEIFAELTRMESKYGMDLPSQVEETTTNSTDSTVKTEPAAVVEPKPARITPERMSRREILDEIDRLEKKCGVEPVKTIRYEQPKPGRNEKCPCNSGIKYKKCCGK